MTRRPSPRHGVALPLALALATLLGGAVAALAWGARVRTAAEHHADRAAELFARADSALAAASCGVEPPGTVWTTSLTVAAARLELRRTAGAGSCWIIVYVDDLPIVGTVATLGGSSAEGLGAGGSVALTESDPRTNTSGGPVRPVRARWSWPRGPSWVDFR